MSSMTAICLAGTAGGILLIIQSILKPVTGHSAGYTLPKAIIVIYKIAN